METNKSRVCRDVRTPFLPALLASTTLGRQSLQNTFCVWKGAGGRDVACFDWIALNTPSVLLGVYSEAGCIGRYTRSIIQQASQHAIAACHNVKPRHSRRCVTDCVCVCVCSCDIPFIAWTFAARLRASSQTRGCGLRRRSLVPAAVGVRHTCLPCIFLSRFGFRPSLRHDGRFSVRSEAVNVAVQKYTINRVQIYINSKELRVCYAGYCR